MFEVHYTKGSCANPEIRKLNPNPKTFETIAEAKEYMDEYAAGDNDVRCDFWLRDTRFQSEPRRRGPKLNTEHLVGNIIMTQIKLLDYQGALLDSILLKSTDPVTFKLTPRQQQTLERWQLWLKGEVR